MALRKEFLRQHYLDQVSGSPAFRAELSAFVVSMDGRLAPRISGKLGPFAPSVKSVESANSNGSRRSKFPVDPDAENRQPPASLIEGRVGEAFHAHRVLEAVTLPHQTVNKGCRSGPQADARGQIGGDGFAGLVSGRQAVRAGLPATGASRAVIK